MIGLNENLGGPPEFSVSNLMRSLEQELAGKPSDLRARHRNLFMTHGRLPATNVNASC
jgi:hypothetical protein